MTDTKLLERAERPLTPRNRMKGARARRGIPPRLVSLAADVALVVGVTLVPLVVVFRLWDGGLRNPFTYFGDSNFYGGTTQNVIETGWYQHSDRLGAPLGQELFDFPLSGDNFHWLVIRFLTVFSSDWALVNNVFYLLGFFAAAISAFFALRWLGARRITAVVASVLFAFAPYHFIRGTSHLLYAAYFVVPIGVVLAVRAFRGEVWFSGLRGAGVKAWLPTLGWIACAALVGSSNSYYAAFSVLLIATAAVAGSVTARDWRPLLAGAGTVVLIGIVLGANLLPSILYSREHGDNPQVAERQAQEVDIYGLRFIQLLTPIPDHRVEPLRELSADLQEGPYNSEQSMFLGVIGSVGLLGMIAWVLVRALRSKPSPDGSENDGPVDDVDDVDDVRPLLAVLTLVAILVSTIGGLAWFIALAGVTELRGWNRMSIVVAFLALAWFALTVDRMLAGRLERPRWRAIAAAGALVVIALGIADQTSKAIIPDRRAYAAEYRADRAYFAEIERRLPRDASVFQLPYVPYPESGPVLDIVDYDPLRPYLNTKHLRWSYGGMRGRESDWQAVVAREPTRQVVEEVVAAGFSGILVDRNGYEDDGAQLVTELAELTGERGFASTNERWVFFDLSELRRQYEQSTSADERDERRAAVLAKRP